MNGCSNAGDVKRGSMIGGLVILVIGLMISDSALAHGVAQGDKGFIQSSSGVMLAPFIYIGAKHMVTGYDHILFLLGVVFFLYRIKDVSLYVSLFAIGHSVTLILGVLGGISVNAYVVDAIIGFSVVYKALDNLGAFEKWFGRELDARKATLIFGLLHGLGLATKVMDYDISPDGLLANLLAFNVGVELGQILALSLILMVMTLWRMSSRFGAQATIANLVLMTAGFMLMGYQTAGFYLS